MAGLAGDGRAAELVLVFEARAEGLIDEDLAELVEPASSDAPVSPPVPELARRQDSAVRWLGNIFDPSLRE